MFAVQHWNCPARGHYSSRTQINVAGGRKMAPVLESPPRPLLKSGMRPLDKYGTYQKTISRPRRPEQMHSPSYIGLEWLRGGIIQVGLE